MPGTANPKIRSKKKSLYDSEKDTPRVKGLRTQYFEKVTELILSRMRFIDEAGVNLGFTRLFGRSEPGKRVREGIPSHCGEQLTLIAALGLQGISAEWVIKGALDGNAFEVYIKEVLLSTLRSGDIVVMDNLPVHKAAWLEKVLKAHHAHLIYLPPYSPDFNPIELCWSKIKSVLRSIKPRSVDELLDALKEAFSSVSLDDIKAWFRHCGYAVH